MAFTPAGATFVALFCSASLHGIYTVIFFGAVHLFWQRKGLPVSKLGTIIKIMTCLMYIFSTVHLALAMHQDYEAYVVNVDANQVFANQGDRYIIAQVSIEIVNCVMADLILIWRAWVLCNRDWRTVAAPCCLLLGTIVCGVGLINGGAKTNSSNAHFSDIFSSTLNAWELSFAAFVFLTNIIATSLIAGRIWYHRRMMQKANLRMLTGKYLNIILIIVESGSLYLLSWVLFMVMVIIGHPAFVVVVDSIAQITGIIPTLIVVLVSLKADAESQMSHSTSYFSRNHTFRVEPNSVINYEVNSSLHRTRSGNLASSDGTIANQWIEMHSSPKNEPIV
ncbi:hypothetical protein BDZ89DRAFT_1140202 [Hymenopellis radicata]|nr:hypothetical protein BDZ89DRAFT_1140202 [Hymenopellis radicata]